MLMTLSGLKQRIKSTELKKGARANFIGYADDFVVTCASKEVLENDIKPLIADFLAVRGLTLLSNLRELIKKHVTLPVNDLIKLINPKLRGWSNYYRHCVAKQVFSYVGHKLFHALWHWARRRHPTKSRTWIALKYFINRKRQWQFHGW